MVENGDRLRRRPVDDRPWQQRFALPMVSIPFFRARAFAMHNNPGTLR